MIKKESFYIVSSVLHVKIFFNLDLVLYDQQNKMVKLTKFTKSTCLNLIKSDKPSNCKQIKKKDVNFKFVSIFSRLCLPTAC